MGLNFVPSTIREVRPLWAPIMNPRYDSSINLFPQTRVNIYMLYATPGRINEAIHRWKWSVAAFETFDGIRLLFVQCGETPTGVLFSGGIDEYLPSSALKYVSGAVEIDEDAKQIRIVRDGKLQGTIQEATEDEEIRALDSYGVVWGDSEKERVKEHIEEFKRQLANMF